MKDYFNLLKQYKDQINRQQFRTFKGQILSGDTKGFVKGLYKVLYGDKVSNRKGEKVWNRYYIEMRQ